MRLFRHIIPVIAAIACVSVSSETAFANSNSGNHAATSRVMVTRDVPVAEFSSIKVNIPCEVKYETGSPSCRIIAPDNIIDHIVAYVDNRQLVLEADQIRLRNYSELEIRISSWALCGLFINGAAEFNAAGKVCAEDFECIVNGACDISIDGIVAENIALTLNGAGSIGIAGIDSKTLSARINGAGNCELRGRTGSADLSISGAGNIDTEHLDAGSINSSIRGLGNISRR